MTSFHFHDIFKIIHWPEVIGILDRNLHRIISSFFGLTENLEITSDAKLDDLGHPICLC